MYYVKVVCLRVPEAEHERWKKAADLVGVSFSWWARDTLHKAAMRVDPPKVIAEPILQIPIVVDDRMPPGVAVLVKQEEILPPDPKKTEKKSKNVPAKLCPHRVPTTMFCKRCSA